MKALKTLRIVLLSFVVLAFAPFGAAWAQIKVTSATPSSTYQGTVSLDVVIAGSGFDQTSQARFFVTGTTNPGGVTVRKTVFHNSKEIVATIDVADTASVASFDVVVALDSGRKGKGTTLFAVQSKTSDPCNTAGLEFPAFIYWVASGTNQYVYAADSTAVCSRLIANLPGAFPAGASFSYPIAGTSNTGRVIWPDHDNTVKAVDFTVSGTAISDASARTVLLVAGPSGLELSPDGLTAYYALDSGGPTGTPTVYSADLATGVSAAIWVGTVAGSHVDVISPSSDGSRLFVEYHEDFGPYELLRIDLPCGGPCTTVLATNQPGIQSNVFPAASLTPDPVLGVPLVVYSDYLPGFNNCWQLKVVDSSGGAQYSGTQPRYGIYSSWYGGKVLTEGRTAPDRRGKCADTGYVTQVDPATGAETQLVKGTFPDGR